MRIAGSRLIKQTIIRTESVDAKLRLETTDRSPVRDFISSSGENFQPDRIEL